MSSRNGALELTCATAAALCGNVEADSPLARVAANIMSSLEAGTRVFLIEWEGHSLPRGIEVDGRRVLSADGNRLTDTHGVIGDFTRTVLDGGQTGHFQQIVLFVRNGN